MNVIKKDSRVCIKATGEIGTVTALTLTPLDQVLLIRLDNGDMKKSLASDVTLATETRKEGITITRDDFRKAVEVACDPSRYNDRLSLSSALLLVMSGTVIASEIERELFGETADND